MAYHLLTYSLIFLPVVIALYQLCPARFRFVVLLAADYTFFCMISGKLLVWLLLATLVTYGTGRWLAAIPVRHSDLHGKALTRKKRGVLALGIVLILGALVTLKYLRVFGVTLAAPIGISYYSLQAISYMTDVYRGTQESCKNPIKVALYLSFFPQIMEGPISRFSETADALYGGNSIQFENLVFGYQRIIWGLFKKMVIADRLAPLVAKVFSNYNNFDGAAILVGVLAYTMQLYMEFSGCMDIIMGSGEIFGVPLPENFRQPFFAKNAGDFWRRWHITLGAWLKDYVFYPISISKFSLDLNKKARKRFGNEFGRIVSSAIPILAVWLLTGIWHGPDWKYVTWGLFHGILIMLSMIFTPYNEKLVQKLHIKTECFSFRLFQMGRTFLLCCLGRVFFRADDFASAIGILKRACTGIGWYRLANGKIYNYGLNQANMTVVIVAMLVLLTVSILQEKMDVLEALKKQNLVFRWVLIYALLLAVVIFGMYGPGYDPSAFIYEKF